MATLTTLLVNGDSVNGPRNWQDQNFADIDETIAAKDDFTARAADKTNNVDTSFLLSGVNSDLGNMDTLSFRFVYLRGSTTDDETGLLCRIVTETDGTVLAAADSGGTFQTVVANGRDTASVTGSVTAFDYVNTTASKAQWDDARIELRGTYAQNMAADSFAAVRVDTLEITGTYSVVGTALVVADSSHSHASDNVALTQLHVLAVADAFHAHAVEPVALTQLHLLTVAEADHAHVAENVVLAAGATNLVVADSAHGHTVEATALTQTHVLVVADATHTHAAENVAVTQAHTLAGVADLAHTHTAENVVLTQGHVLAGVAKPVHSHTVDGALILTQLHQMAAADAAHSHGADNVTLTQVHVLAVADAFHAHTAENVVLAVGEVTLVVADAFHGHSVDPVVLTQIHVLLVDDAAHTHTADSVALTQLHALAVDDSTHTHAIDSPALVVDLAVADSTHGHASDNVALTQVHALVVSDATHSHAVDNVELTGEGSLVVADAVHAHTADGAVLTQDHTLAVDGSFHSHDTAATLVRPVTLATLYADGHITGTVTTPANALDITDDIWTTDTTASWASRFAMEDTPASSVLDGTQTVTVLARQAPAGTGTPTITVELWEDGVFVKNLVVDELVTA